MSEHPELQAKILEWQRRWNIADGDPAMALIELLNIYGYRGGAPVVVAPPTAGNEGVAAPMVSLAGVDEAVIEQIRGQLLPAIDRIGFQTQELKQKLDAMALDSFVQQVATYHEGIDYCTKKLDVVKKDSDALVVQLGKVATSIKPVSRGAVLVLVLVAFIMGILAAVALHMS